MIVVDISCMVCKYSDIIYSDYFHYFSITQHIKPYIYGFIYIALYIKVYVLGWWAIDVVGKKSDVVDISCIVRKYDIK